MTLGGAVLASWSRTQKSVSLSSAEAEFYAIVTGATESIYIQTLLSELDYQVGIRVRTDSSAAAAFAQKPGLGRLKHIQLREAFLKDLVSEGVIVLEKVRGTANCSNVLTKPVQAAELEQDLAGVPTFEVGAEIEVHMVQVGFDMKDQQQAMTVVEAPCSPYHWPCRAIHRFRHCHVCDLCDMQRGSHMVLRAMGTGIAGDSDEDSWSAGTSHLHKPATQFMPAIPAVARMGLGSLWQ